MAITQGNSISKSNHSNTPPVKSDDAVQFAEGSTETPESPGKDETRPTIKRRQTMLTNVQTHFAPHKYVIRRPRALQIEYAGDVVKIGDYGRVDLDELGSRQLSQTTSTASDSSEPQAGDMQNQGHHKKHLHERSTDNIEKQRERLDLFIDLIWVGIVTNLSENYYAQTFEETNAVHDPVSVFVALFLSAWQIWLRLQIFLNSYYMDDTIQRMFILWILALGIAWGNNAPYVLSGPSSNGALIGFYLAAINSVVLAECLYSIWLPWLRKYLLVRALLSLPSTAMWVCAVIFGGSTRFGLIWGAVIYDKVITFIITSPSSRIIFRDGVRKAVDYKHLRSRYESFFVIALGEGIILLLRGSPLGEGLTVALSRGVLVLTLYYVLHAIYFGGDQGKFSVNPVHRRWWIKSLWQLLHVFLFGSLILLSSGLSYLVGSHPEEKEGAVHSKDSGEKILGTRSGTENPVDDSKNMLRTAIATSYACLSIILFLTLVMALLSKPLDPPKTLIVNNRYLRLIPRAAAVPVFAAAWRAEFQNAGEALGIMTLVCVFVFSWEFYTSMETGCRFLEPKHVDS